MLVMRRIVTGLRRQEYGFVLVCLRMADQRPSSRSRDDLVAIETQHTEASKCTAGLSFIVRPQRLGGIFDLRNIKLFCDCQNLVHFGRHTVEMYHDDGLGLLAFGETIAYSLAKLYGTHIPR